MNKDKYTTTLVVVFFVIVLIAFGGFIFTYIKSNNNLSDNGNNEANVAPSNNPSSNEPSGTNNSGSSVSDNPYVPPIAPPSEPKEVVIAEYTTDILDRQGNRIHNMKLANSKLDGHIVSPGDTFSFNGAVGPMGGDQGYKKATAFKANGAEYKEWGGGICQISSTLYNAVLIAGLEVVERHPHSKRVYYVPKDKDATIYYGSLDFRFKNNTDHPIKVLSNSDDKHMVIKLISMQ